MTTIWLPIISTESKKKRLQNFVKILMDIKPENVGDVKKSCAENVRCYGGYGKRLKKRQKSQNVSNDHLLMSSLMTIKHNSASTLRRNNEYFPGQ